MFIYACRHFGKLTSGGLFLSWLIFTICGAPELYYWLNVSAAGKVEPFFFLINYQQLQYLANGERETSSVHDMVVELSDRVDSALFCWHSISIQTIVWWLCLWTRVWIWVPRNDFIVPDSTDNVVVQLGLHQGRPQATRSRWSLRTQHQRHQQIFGAEMGKAVGQIHEQ